MRGYAKYVDMGIMVLMDLALIIAAAFISLYLRFDSQDARQLFLLNEYLGTLYGALPALALFYLGALAVSGVYVSSWRDEDRRDFLVADLACFLGAAVFFAYTKAAGIALPRMFFVLDLILTAALISFSRRVIQHVQRHALWKMKALRPLQIEDLLEREPVRLDLQEIAAYLTGKVVLVTGAGGSIGSELCRQIMRMKPAKLILLGRGENSIYLIHRELSQIHGKEKLVPVIANICNRNRLEDVFGAYRPQVVFHAAAHKHVPLMEAQPKEAVYNNVYGSLILGETAGTFGVDKFITISTDKAVNPTSVMGASKCLVEMVMQILDKRFTATHYMTVRFGNVLGSRGSVVPLFLKQIEAGGPVTVTHPDMQRYFMTIPEASQLVLQAGSMGKGGEVFVLDMGRPVKILDLAKKMIRICTNGRKDIEIVFTGLRPGEKLYEEILTAEEGTASTRHEKIFRAPLKKVDERKFMNFLYGFQNCHTDEEFIKVFQQLIPSYKPNRPSEPQRKPDLNKGRVA